MISNYATYHASLARRDDLPRQTAEWGRANEGARDLPDAAHDELAAWVCQGRVNVAVAITPAWRCGCQPMRAQSKSAMAGSPPWTAWLTGNAKERCLVSCLATERLTDLAEPQRPSGFGICVSTTRNARSASCSTWRAGPAFTTNT